MEKQELIDYTVGGILEKYVAEDPDHEFMIYPDRGLRFTYKEFDERVNIFAKGLLSIGVTKGSKVGVWAKNVPDWMTFMFATAKIGAVLVTVNTNYKNAELEYIMKNADIHTMCMVNGYRDSDYVQILYDLVPELKTTQRGKLRSEKFPELRNVVYIGQEKLRGMYNTSELMKLGTLVGDDELERVKSRVDCHDEINMQYTSGTTGFPKGVMLTSHNILNNGLTIGDRMHFTAADRLLICVPLFHCFGCVLGVCSVITHGSTMVMVEDFDPLKVLASVHRERCTALHGVPTYRDHGRRALPDRDDEAGDGQNVLQGDHQRIRPDRNLARYDGFGDDRFDGDSRDDRRAGFSERRGEGARSANQRGMSSGDSRRDVLQGVQHHERVLQESGSYRCDHRRERFPAFGRPRRNG